MNIYLHFAAFDTGGCNALVQQQGRGLYASFVPQPGVDKGLQQTCATLNQQTLYLAACQLGHEGLYRIAVGGEGECVDGGR